jgi:hypothetical protein
VRRKEVALESLFVTRQQEEDEDDD